MLQMFSYSNSTLIGWRLRFIQPPTLALVLLDFPKNAKNGTYDMTKGNLRSQQTFFCPKSTIEKREKTHAKNANFVQI